jgi:hypothetical protein
MWVVGDYGTIRRWDGHAWEHHDSGTLAQLFAITGSAPNDIWAAGEDGVMLHFDGAVWREVPSGVRMTINDLWTDAHGTVLAAAGNYIGGGNATYDGTVLRWTGSAWLPDDVPNVPSLPRPTTRFSASGGKTPSTCGPWARTATSTSTTALPGTKSRRLPTARCTRSEATATACGPSARTAPYSSSRALDWWSWPPSTAG